jgi:hypothetical protein
VPARIGIEAGEQPDRRDRGRDDDGRDELVAQRWIRVGGPRRRIRDPRLS